MLVLKDGTRLNIQGNSLILEKGLKLWDIKAFEVTVYGEVKTVKLKDLLPNLLTFENGTLTVKLDCDLSEGDTAFARIDLQFINCIGNIENARIILKNGTSISFKELSINLAAAI